MTADRTFNQLKHFPQALAMQVHAVPVLGAPYGPLGGYMAIEPEKLHARQSSILFEVDAPQSMAKEPSAAPSMVGLAWAKAGIPVAVLGYCLGKVYIAAAFNLLDPATRARLREATTSGKLTGLVKFNSTDPTKPAGNVDTALIGVGAEFFEEALERTEGLKVCDPKEWRKAALPTMLKWLAAEGINDRVLNRIQLVAFAVVPVEPDGGLCAGWA